MRKLILFFVMIAMLASFVDAEIRVTMLNQDPDPVNAGDVVKVRFMVENTGEKTPDDVIISVVEDTPFTVYDKVNERNLGKMNGFTRKSDAPVIDFRLLVDETANDGENELNLRIKVGGTEVITKELYYVDVQNKEINLKTFIRDSTLITASNKGVVSIGIANAGSYDIKFLGMTLMPSDDYRLLSKSSYSYIRNLDPDDTESEDIEIYVPKNIETVNIPLKLNYEINEVSYEQEETLTLNLLTASEAKKIGLIKSNTGLVITFVVLALALLYIIWRKFIRK